jgi:hypothetical protein
MRDPHSHQADPQTRGTAPVKFFEADGGTPPPGTKATPRPADRPREVPAGSLPSGTLERFECAEPSVNQGARATPRPARKGPPE